MRDRNAPLSEQDIGSLAWSKMDGLLPAAIQDSGSGRLLMLGYMNEEALRETLRTGLATFFSRSKARLWQKGETSGNHLKVVSVHEDCDGDALLVRAEPSGRLAISARKAASAATAMGPAGLPNCRGSSPAAPPKAMRRAIRPVCWGKALSGSRRRWARRASKSPLPQ
jgi:phosphoribosyl-ATP pyrophosphohydrolase/phosphoribosyl-AMP cyclohydrolase